MPLSDVAKYSMAASRSLSATAELLVFYTPKFPMLTLIWMTRQKLEGIKDNNTTIEPCISMPCTEITETFSLMK